MGSGQLRIHFFTPFIEDISGLYTSPFLDINELKMALLEPEKFPGLLIGEPPEKKNGSYISITILIQQHCLCLCSLGSYI